MAVSAADVKKLRDATGAGMMDCKKALTEADGEFDQAVEILRVNGQAKAAKRGAERSATNGLVAFTDGALLQLGDPGGAQPLEGQLGELEPLGGVGDPGGACTARVGEQG